MRGCIAPRATRPPSVMRLRAAEADVSAATSGVEHASVSQDASHACRCSAFAPPVCMMRARRRARTQRRGEVLHGVRVLARFEGRQAGGDRLAGWRAGHHSSLRAAVRRRSARRQAAGASLPCVPTTPSQTRRRAGRVVWRAGSQTPGCHESVLRRRRRRRSPARRRMRHHAQRATRCRRHPHRADALRGALDCWSAVGFCNKCRYAYRGNAHAACRPLQRTKCRPKCWSPSRLRV